MVFMRHLWRNLNMFIASSGITSWHVTSSLKKEMHSLIQRIHVVCNCLKTLTFLGGLMKHAYNYTAIVITTQQLTLTNVWFTDNMKLLLYCMELVATVHHWSAFPASRGMEHTFGCVSVDPISEPILGTCCSFGSEDVIVLLTRDWCSGVSWKHLLNVSWRT